MFPVILCLKAFSNIISSDYFFYVMLRIVISFSFNAKFKLYASHEKRSGYRKQPGGGLLHVNMITCNILAPHPLKLHRYNSS